MFTGSESVTAEEVKSGAAERRRDDQQINVSFRMRIPSVCRMQRAKAFGQLKVVHERPRCPARTSEVAPKSRRAPGQEPLRQLRPPRNQPGHYHAAQRWIAIQL